MENLDHYNREMKDIAREAGKNKGVIGGGTWAWVMMLIGVAVTGTMTYALTRKGMASSVLWAAWVAFAAVLPVFLLEGSALALVYGRHHWFRSPEQREIAGVASWVIWIVLAATTVAHFALGSSQNAAVQAVMDAYASYLLPSSIVAVPMLWKRLYDAAPESAMRIAVLETEASLKSQLVEIQSEQNDLMIIAMREAMKSPEVMEARKKLFAQASIEHAANIVGFIDGAEHQEVEPRYELPDGKKARIASASQRGNFEGKQ